MLSVTSLLAGLLLAAASDWRVLAARGDRTCASHSDGLLYCWGGKTFASSDWLPEAQQPGRLELLAGDTQHCLIDRYHHLGCGHAGVYPPALLHDTNTRARAVAFDRRHGCRIDMDGGVSCWRWSDGLYAGLRPVGSHDAIPVPVEDAVALAAFTAVPLADERSTFCALRGGGAVDCWTLGCPSRRLAVTRVAADVVELTGGRYFCGRASGGAVTCWNGAQELCASGPPPKPVAVTLTEAAVDIEAGETLACARGVTGSVACWPLQSGHFDFAVAAPVGGPAAVALAVGGSHACLRDRSDGVWCWGAATNEQLLDRDYLDEVAEPSRIEGIRDAVALAGTPTRVCALLADRRVACWGAVNAPGEPPTWSSVPRPIGGLTDAVAVFATGERELCARRSNHRVACWGATAGLRHARDARPEPQDPWTAASCQVDLRGEVWCDGANHRGQRGCSYRDDSPPDPTAVCDLSEPAVEVARGRSHACALHPSGHVSCWGDNRWFQLGQATAPMPASSELPEDPWYAPTALRVPEIEDATQVLAVGDYTCALHRSGEVSCWGDNSTGQCGQGSGEPQPEPVRVELPLHGMHTRR